MRTKRDNRPPAKDPELLQTHTEKLIWPGLLFLLCHKPAHGYELIQRLHETGLLDGDADPATIYRNLRRLEEVQFVESHWESGPSGPARRLYHLTPAGEQALHDFARLLGEKRRHLDEFLHRYRKLFPDDPARIGKEGE